MKPSQKDSHTRKKHQTSGCDVGTRKYVHSHARIEKGSIFTDGGCGREKGIKWKKQHHLMMVGRHDS